MRDLKVRLDQTSSIIITPGLLGVLTEVSVAVRQPDRITGRVDRKTFDLKYDEDGLLSIRGSGENERDFAPVLTAENKWVLRDKAGLVSIIDIDAAPVPDKLPTPESKTEYGKRYRKKAAEARAAKSLGPLGGAETPASEGVA